MRQLLLRVPDDVHARLADRAKVSGRSVNSIATEILDNSVDDSGGDARTALRAKARRLGVLADSGPARAASPQERERAIASTEGLGPVLDKLLADGR